ncbi:MAG TPA: MFS transporter [Stellaceae bacterium]|nr:MFS transporter [Stellaceae bacterium]
MAATEIGHAGRRAVTADDISNRIDRLPFLPFHFKIASILGTGTFFDAFDSLSIGVALTMIVASFKLDFRDSGALLGAAFVGQFFGAIAFGYVSEHIGRKRAFVLAIALFGVCSVGAAIAASVSGIYWARVIQGIGLGGEVPVAVSLFTEFLSSRARGLFTLVYETMFAWGIFIAPAVALGCLKAFGPEMGWRVLFAVGGIPAFVAIIAAWKLPESARWLAAKGRLAEADRTVQRMEDEAARLGKPLIPSHPVTVRRERTRFSELFRGIYARRTFVVWSMWFCPYFIANGYQSWAPTLYMKIGGLPASDAIILSLVTGGLQLCITYTVAFTIDRVGRIRWFTGGYVVAVLGAILGVIVTGPMGIRTWPALFFCGIVMGTGASTCAGIVYVFTPELYPTRMRAWATSTASSLNRLGSFSAPMIVGWLLAEWNAIPLVFAMFGVVALYAAIVIVTMGEEGKRRALEDLAP